ncbi:DUF4240 domain-containing protein [Actinomadura spongiicola]|uniref:DUF4240 domain-containing protein n=1 Tax=Actinomadura spongiicola TaxID=2303421 RepID=A0A372GE44_9ACTN|nr:DUF4240 domain-containing protein [Actinomadura spongiicola]RFS83645.1 DUF4240 domain-containing protein [Actinomadura spongiicola]
MPEFWSVIGSNSVQTSVDVQAALERVSARLNGLPPAELIDFVEQLRAALYEIDRRELAEIPVKFKGLTLPQTGDHFLYARCACVLAGREAYHACLETSSEFARFVRPSSQSAELLLYIAEDAYRRETGKEVKASQAFSIESMSNPRGWTE